MSEQDEGKSIDRVIDDLRGRFPSVPREEIAGIVTAKYREFDGAPVRDYIPVMVERDAKQSLQAVAGPPAPRRVAA